MNQYETAPTMVEKLNEKYIEETSLKKKLIQAAAAFAAGAGLMTMLSTCSGSKEAATNTPPKQLEQAIMQLAPQERARVVYNVAKHDMLDEENSYSARAWFLESQIRQENERDK
ncbi:hypothetical protein KY333_04900 [Candidatus Woesearchaeota archaeon]|nr:hypothetical protein [Candidatus Woesearchaeota archaeon]MBW2993845.1 hypothetical protein [Candidatus Woesearchaeota archaeon]